MVKKGLLPAFIIGRSVRITPEAVHECEEMLTVRPMVRRRGRRDHQIDPEVAKLLDGNWRTTP
jgi:hypothetical protein